MNKPTAELTKIASQIRRDIVDITKNKETELSDNSDQFVLNKLKEMGYKDFDHQKLFVLVNQPDQVLSGLVKR